jgi:hypothetical protein
MTRPDLKLVHDRDGLPVERLAAEYWRAASSLRGSDNALVSPDAATRCLHDLAHTCRHDGLRRAADGTLTSLGLRDHGSPGGSPGPEAA